MAVIQCNKCGLDETTLAEKHQTQMYGLGMRVHNPTSKSSKDRKVMRCACCGTERDWTGRGK